MIALGIETATTVCGVALHRDRMTPIVRLLDIPNVHSEQLVPLIDDVMQQSGLGINQLDAIAVSIGPGSFTGLRIGLSVAKGLSFASDIPLIPVPTLQALAFNLVGPGSNFSGREILSLLDAHREEAYWAIYRTTADREVEECKHAIIASYGEIAEWIQNHPNISIVGDAQKLMSTMEGPRHRWLRDFSRCNPVSVVTIGVQRYRAGERADRSSLEPYYLREFTPRGARGV